jgi:hypothetical protein
MLHYFLARAREPSSYAGLATLLSAAGIAVATPEWQAIVAVLTAVAGLLAVLFPEPGAAP